MESISIIWTGRTENRQKLSQKIVDALETVSKALPEIYHEWYALGYSFSESFNQEVIINGTRVETILKDNEDKKSPDLGTKIILWNGEKNAERQASFSARLGVCPNNVNLKNNFILNFPDSNTLTLKGLKDLITYLYSTFQGEILKINGELTDYPFRILE